MKNLRIIFLLLFALLTDISQAQEPVNDTTNITINLKPENTVGYPVTGIMGDTLFRIYERFGVLSAKERAVRISNQIKVLYEDDFLVIDSIKIVENFHYYDILYGENIIMSLSETDALFYNKNIKDLAVEFRNLIAISITEAKTEYSTQKILLRSGFVLLILIVAMVIFWLVGIGYQKIVRKIESRKNLMLHDLKYKDYTFLNNDQQFRILSFVLNLLRWFLYLLLLYVAFSALFSIFPFTRGWATKLISFVISPLNKLGLGIIKFLPNLISIIIIIIIMKYFIKLVKYIFMEIETGKLTISGFHTDWASPTFSIVKWLLYAFMFVLIFPLLPGSDSNIFKGVSVFIGILFSLGSSSAIANVIAGLVITYMRPFKIGDRIKIGEISGDVIEKSLLVTRIKTTKNEEITIPNSSLLSGNTTNYSTIARNEGLIVYTTVTIGYDVPWRKMHETLLESAKRTSLIMKEPKPFVLQTSLDDFYVAYQLNGYTREANKMALIYSELHQNIQDCCNEVGIEIMSPHYRAARDGNTSTIPADYLPENYQTPGFNINIDKQK